MNLFRNPLKDNTIHARVMSVIQDRISNAQSQYDDECCRIDDGCDASVRAIEDQRVHSKDSAADAIVDTIIGNN